MTDITEEWDVLQAKPRPPRIEELLYCIALPGKLFDPKDPDRLTNAVADAMQSHEKDVEQSEQVSLFVHTLDEHGDPWGGFMDSHEVSAVQVLQCKRYDLIHRLVYLRSRSALAVGPYPKTIEIYAQLRRTL
jgi:hypothetical protein